MTALDSMVRVHRWMLDEKRRALGELQVFSDKLRNDLVALDAGIDDERAAAGRDEQVNLTYPAFVAAALDRRKKLCETIANLDKEIDALRQEVGEVFQELKKYELAKDNTRRREGAKRARKDRLAQDELGVGLYRRNQSQGD